MEDLYKGVANTRIQRERLDGYMWYSEEREGKKGERGRERERERGRERKLLRWCLLLHVYSRRDEFSANYIRILCIVSRINSIGVQLKSRCDPRLFFTITLHTCPCIVPETCLAVFAVKFSCCCVEFKITFFFHCDVEERLASCDVCDKVRMTLSRWR